MARLRFAYASTAEIALTTAQKTLIQLLAPANQRMAVRGWGIAFDGVSSTAGAVDVRLCIFSSSNGSYTGATLVKDLRGTTEAIQTSGRFNNTSNEGSISDTLRSYEVNPMTGYERAFAQDEEIEIAGGERFGIIAIASSAVNCHVFVNAEE